MVFNLAPKKMNHEPCPDRQYMPYNHIQCQRSRKSFSYLELFVLHSDLQHLSGTE